VATIETWVARLRRACPVTSLALELVRFDTHAMQSPDIYGVKYQQGSLHGYEVRGYLLQKWERRCAYCGAKDVPLQVAHIVPKARGDSDRVSNLTLACNDCNQWKGSQAAAEFGFPTIQGQSKQPLKDAAVVNTTRLRLYERLRTTGLPLACGSGGRTKSNRTQQDYPKAHRIDAACVGTTDDQVRLDSNMSVLVIRAMGHGNQQMCWTNRHGFPIRHRTRVKRFWGFQTGDLVRAVVPTGNHQGMHVRRVTIRQRPSFRENGVDVHPKYVRVLQKRDGYGYELRHGGAGATRAAFAVDGT
jgi:5-methylcytosine-specific restriction endonuclease McrA